VEPGVVLAPYCEARRRPARSPRRVSETETGVRDGCQTTRRLETGVRRLEDRKPRRVSDDSKIVSTRTSPRRVSDDSKIVSTRTSPLTPSRGMPRRRSGTAHKTWGLRAIPRLAPWLESRVSNPLTPSRDTLSGASRRAGCLTQGARGRREPPARVLHALDPLPPPLRRPGRFSWVVFFSRFLGGPERVSKDSTRGTQATERDGVSLRVLSLSKDLKLAH